MAIYKESHLYYQDSRSDKEYHLTLESDGNGHYMVLAKFGPRGGTLTHVDKTHGYTTYTQALSTFNKTDTEKRAKGYTDNVLQSRIQKATGIRTFQLTTEQWASLDKFCKDYAEEQF